jgi:hypothetical protein
MSSQSAVTKQDLIDHQQSDLEDTLDVADPAFDETWSDVQHRERAERRDTKQREQLAGRHARAVYRRNVLHTLLLTPPEALLLCELIEYADADLSNIFPKRRSLRLRCGARRRHQLVTSLVRKGFLQLWSLTDGRDVDAVAWGIGYQLLLPAGVLARDAEPWMGPVGFCNWRRWQDPGE